MKLTVAPFNSAIDSVSWDELCAVAPMATFLHTRRFLAYHGDRFKDVSLLLKDEQDRLVGLFPAAVDLIDHSQVVSHPGLTYGGVVHSGKLRGAAMLNALQVIVNYYAGQGFRALRYKVVPVIYHLPIAQDDLYALFRLDARRYRCDLSCTIDLAHRGTTSQRRRRGLKKAIANSVEIVQGVDYAQHYWVLVEENLTQKHNARPVHTSAEIQRLQALFPENIQFVIARQKEDIIAGTVLFMTPNVVHAQYIASTQTGRELSALDRVFEHCIGNASESGARYFDFGISTEQDGQYLNETLYQFKSEFGGHGTVHEFFEIELN